MVFSREKPKIVASSMSLAKKVPSGLRKAGVKDFSAATSVRDLGIGFAGGRRRVVKVRNDRLAKAKKRLEVIQNLSQT